MPGIWKTVRVFISSTFRDMHAERDHLVKVVFTALRERLEKHRIFLIDIDLRWGVTREQAENDQVLGLCLKQIDECRPFFIGILGERYGWVPTRYPADALKHFGWIQHHTGRSVTELEIFHGVLQDSNMRGRAFFYFRDPVAVHGVPEAIRQNIYAETAPNLIRKLEELKQQIRTSGYPVMENYPARWDLEAYDRPSRSKGRLVGLEAFGERVRDQLWQAIQEEFQLQEQPAVAMAADPLAEEQDYHERFMESRLRVYVGREQINDALLAFADGNDPVPFLVTGPSGSGKSAALARFVCDYRNKQPQTLVIPHFIGASPRSTNLHDMLRRFCQILKGRFGFAEEVPEETAKLSVTFREFVGKVPTDARVLLVIDALNQLDEADRAQELYWLPTELPPQVKVIVSCISDSGKTEPVLQAFRWRKHSPVHIDGLSDGEQRLIIRQVPSLSAKTLDEEQVRLLLSNPATTNPLFLLVALEELRGFAPYERLNERIAAFPRERDTVTAIFTQVIERLEEEFNKKLVETVLTLLASARRGLSERELQELVAGLDAADDLFPVLRQLRPYLLSRAGLIDFYHRNLFKAVRERYLASEDQQRLAHARLAEYFHAQDYWLESLEEQQRRAKTLPPTPRPANVRKVEELAWQRLRAKQWSEAEELFTHHAFLEAKAEAGFVSELASEFGEAVEGMPRERSKWRMLKLLKEAIGHDLPFIARHPITLFQCLWNSCWWYDCPNAALHYDAPRGGWEAEEPPWEQGGEKLHEWMRRWREAKERAGTFPWVRSLRPPAVPLGGALRAICTGHFDTVNAVAFSPDCKVLASGSWDRTVRLWDRDSGRELSCLRGHDSIVNTLSWSGDGRVLASGSNDNTVRLWDGDSGRELACLRGHEGSVYPVCWSGDGRVLASGSEDNTVRLWERDSGRELACLRGHEYGVTTLSWSVDGRVLASGARERTIRLWERDSGRELACLHGHEGSVYALCWSEDGRVLASGSKDHTVRLWDRDSGRELACLRGHEREVTTLAWSEDGRVLASGSDDSTVRIWDRDSGREVACLRGHESHVKALSWSGDGRVLAIGSDDSTVRLWERESGHELACLRGHEYGVTTLSWSVDGRVLASGSRDNTVRLWQRDSGRELARLRGHESHVNALTWSGDGRVFATGSYDQTVRLWDRDSGLELACLRGHEGNVYTLCWSGDGRVLASGSNDNTVRLWERDSGRELACLRGLREFEGSVSVLSWSGDGRVLACGWNFDGTVRLWERESGRELAHLRGHEGSVRTLSWSADGRVLASGSSDETVRLWERESGRELACLRGHEGEVCTLSWSVDGLCLRSKDSGGTVLFWNVPMARRLTVEEHGRLSPSFTSASRVVGYSAYTREGGTAVAQAGSEMPLAWFPATLDWQSADGLVWAARSSSEVYLLRLEGVPEEHGNSPPPI